MKYEPWVMDITTNNEMTLFAFRGGKKVLWHVNVSSTWRMRWLAVMDHIDYDLPEDYYN